MELNLSAFLPLAHPWGLAPGLWYPPNVFPPALSPSASHSPPAHRDRPPDLQAPHSIHLCPTAGLLRAWQAGGKGNPLYTVKSLWFHSLRWALHILNKCQRNLEKSLFLDSVWLSRLMTQLKKNTKILFWWQKTRTSLSFPFSSCYNNINTPALSSMASCTPSSTRQNSYHWLLEHFFKEMQNEKSGAPEKYSINNSCNSGGHYPPSGSFIHFLVAGPALVSLILTCHVTLARHQWKVVFFWCIPHVSPRPLSACSSSFYDCHLASVTACGQWVSKGELLTSCHLAELFFYLFIDWRSLTKM